MAKLFEWQMENSSTVDYSVGDAIGTSEGTVSFDGTIKQSGSYSLKYTGGGDYYFDVTSLDIIKNSGSAQFYFYLESYSNQEWPFGVHLGSSSNQLRFHVNNMGSEYYARAIYGGNGDQLATPTWTADTQLLTGQFYKITMRWRTGAANPSLSFQVDSNAVATIDTDLTPWTVTTGTLKVGPDGPGQTGYLDNLKIWDNWDGPEEGGTPSLDRWHPGTTQPHRRIVEVVPY